MITPKTIADECGISERWARVLCRRIVGRKKYYRLTAEQHVKVIAEYNEWKRQGSSA